MSTGNGKVDHQAVVVTGLGVISPAGNTLEDFWAAMLDGQSKARPIRRFDARELPVNFACEVDPEFDTLDVLNAKEMRRMDRFVQFGLVSAMLALSDAGNPTVSASRSAVVAGTGMGGANTNSSQMQRFFSGGPTSVHPLTIPMGMPNAAAAQIAIKLGWTGPNYTIASACASGAHAVGEGVRLLRDGSADLVLAGASDACVTPFALTAFSNLQALSSRNDDPSRASRPFDVDRDGFVMSEGSAFCILERLDDARRRGARIYCSLAGYGRNCDAHHVVMPHPDGRGATDCIGLALTDAGIEARDIVQVNAHGTSTKLNDRTEVLALRNVFGDGIPPITAPKSVLGHMVAAAGAVELVASCLSIWHGQIPPTGNFERGDDDNEDIPVVKEVRSMPPGPVLTNSFGFGGHNASLVLTPVESDSTNR